MNRVVLAGRITRDPELQNPVSDSPFVRFSLAVDRPTRDSNGNKVADFFQCVAFRQSARFISNYVKKGCMLVIDGKLQTNTFTGQDGITRTSVDIVVDNVQNIEPRQQDPVTKFNADRKKQTTADCEFSIDDEDLPF